MFQADKVNREIILDLLRLRGSLSAYVSREDIKEIERAEKAFESGKMDNDGLLAIVCSAKKKAEERFTRKEKSREELQQAIRQVLEKTNNLPVILRAEIKDRCEEEQSWLDGQVNKNDEFPTADEITASACKEAESRLKDLNAYFQFVMENAKPPEKPKQSVHQPGMRSPNVVKQDSVRQPVLKAADAANEVIPHYHASRDVPKPVPQPLQSSSGSVEQTLQPADAVSEVIPHYHASYDVPKSNRKSKMKPIVLYDTLNCVIRDMWGMIAGFSDYSRVFSNSPKCTRSECPSRGKPHSHTINASEYDARRWPYLILCTESKCGFWHAHPYREDEDWLFDAFRDERCDCIKLHQHPENMPKEAEIFEQPVDIPN